MRDAGRLPEVNVLRIEDRQLVLEIHVECRTSRPGCPVWGVAAHSKDQRMVTLVDLPCFGKCTRHLWHKRRWRCPDPDPANSGWTNEGDHIAAPRPRHDRPSRPMDHRAGRPVRSQRERGGHRSSTSSPAALASNRGLVGRGGARSGVTRCASRPWTSRVRIARCSR